MGLQCGRQRGVGVGARAGALGSGVFHYLHEDCESAGQRNEWWSAESRKCKVGFFSRDGSYCSRSGSCYRAWCWSQSRGSRGVSVLLVESGFFSASQAESRLDGRWVQGGSESRSLGVIRHMQGTPQCCDGTVFGYCQRHTTATPGSHMHYTFAAGAHFTRTPQPLVRLGWRGHGGADSLTRPPVSYLWSVSSRWPQTRGGHCLGEARKSFLDFEVVPVFYSCRLVGLLPEVLYLRHLPFG